MQSYPKILKKDVPSESYAGVDSTNTSGPQTSPLDSSLTHAQFKRLIADYRRTGYELAEYWQRKAS